MSSFGGESHSMSNVSGLKNFVEPSQIRTSSFDHEEEDILFRVVCKTSPVSPPAPTVIISVTDAPAPASLAGVASTMTQEDVIHLRGMYGVPNSVRVFAPDHGDRVTSGPKGGVTLYEGFFHASLHFRSTSLFSAFWIMITSFLPSSLRILLESFAPSFSSTSMGL